MKALKLAVVQFTPEFGNKEKNFSRMQKLVEDVTADIIVFPELCTTGYFFQSRAEVAKSAVIGVPSELGEEDVMAVIKLKLNVTTTPESILDFCQEKMAYFMLPR